MKEHDTLQEETKGSKEETLSNNTAGNSADQHENKSGQQKNNGSGNEGLLSLTKEEQYRKVKTGNKTNSGGECGPSELDQKSDGQQGSRKLRQIRDCGAN